MIEVYAIQSVVAAKIKVWECSLVNQVNAANKNIKKNKLVIEET